MLNVDEHFFVGQSQQPTNHFDLNLIVEKVNVLVVFFFGSA